MHRFLSILACLLPMATGTPLPLSHGPMVAQVEESVTTTTISGYAQHAGGPKQPPPLDAPPLAVLRIDWLNQEPAPTGFAIEQKNRSKISSNHHLGRTGITRTILATDDAIFIHVLADQPGAVALKVSLTSPQEGTTIPQGRNELLWNGKEDPIPKAYLRLIPFESDVEAEGESIVLRGEGECLVIFSFTAADDAKAPLFELWKRLAATYDPGADHPDPVKIWQAILEKQAPPAP